MLCPHACSVVLVKDVRCCLVQLLAHVDTYVMSRTWNLLHRVANIIKFGYFLIVVWLLVGESHFNVKRTSQVQRTRWAFTNGKFASGCHCNRTNRSACFTQMSACFHIQSWSLSCSSSFAFVLYLNIYESKCVTVSLNICLNVG